MVFPVQWGKTMQKTSIHLWRKVISLFITVMMGLSVLAPAPFIPAIQSSVCGAETAQAEYMEFGNLIEEDKEGNVQVSGGQNLVQSVIDGVLRPLTTIMLIAAILMFGWRTAYLAIFPLIAGIDPLNMLSDARYTGVKGGGNSSRYGKGGGKGKSQRIASADKALKQEAAGMLKGLIIALAVWSILQIMMLIAVLVIGAGGEIAQNAT